MQTLTRFGKKTCQRDSVNASFISNLPFFRTDDMEGILRQCYRLPDEGEEGEWLDSKDVLDTLHKQFPNIMVCHATKVRIGQVLRYLGCSSKRTRYGTAYSLVKIAA